MPTNEERRNLAQNLRGGYDVTWNSNGLFWLNGTLFGMDICARSEEKIRNGLRHLAAFIEPEPERACDRDGLLALADLLKTPEQEVDCAKCPLRKWCEEARDSGHVITCFDCKVWHTADAIREMCGAEAVSL